MFQRYFFYVTCSFGRGVQKSFGCRNVCIDDSWRCWQFWYWPHPLVTRCGDAPLSLTEEAALPLPSGFSWLPMWLTVSWGVRFLSTWCEEMVAVDLFYYVDLVVFDQVASELLSWSEISPNLCSLSLYVSLLKNLNPDTSFGALSCWSISTYMDSDQDYVFYIWTDISFVYGHLKPFIVRASEPPVYHSQYSTGSGCCFTPVPRNFKIAVVITSRAFHFLYGPAFRVFSDGVGCFVWI